MIYAVTDVFLFWIPFYYELKLAFKGMENIFYSHIAPLFRTFGAKFGKLVSHHAHNFSRSRETLMIRGIEFLGKLFQELITQLNVIAESKFNFKMTREELIKTPEIIEIDSDSDYEYEVDDEINDVRISVTTTQKSKPKTLKEKIISLKKRKYF
ncbi:hypothetical protein ROZALSC1DRAFT_29521 [Rozella allomycis CSF55]|uniref:Uncharacterized protein n=1 Tax=Rozella allomycis (strain CSF55) TaxID=988480 RepID=A0A075B0B3_ROZAC|nr:hypothetical protein O9G_001842 [Rozella allomycis CSF55]RKP18831.1 hypothetical protein ROZALSC1DRAFT_29521 [Rozella allomycis CSF55]|eukprot:EPZ34229.1 hypothetical protein O9G_001842 [Rozella allomycis CSF55]